MENIVQIKKNVQFRVWLSDLTISDLKFGFYAPKSPPGSNSEAWKRDFSSKTANTKRSKQVVVSKGK